MDLAKYIDHALLRPDLTEKEIEDGLLEAKENNYFGVCVNLKYIELASKILKGSNTKVVAVIGFPLGAVPKEVKVFETKLALEKGADEIDMVADIGAIKEGNIQKVVEDIKSVVETSQGKIVKVILETDLLTKEEIILGCKASIEAKADFVKTSTGFAKDGKGATIETIKLMKDTVKNHGLKVKASGGIKNKATAIEMIEAGADRLGTSCTLKIIEE